MKDFNFKKFMLFQLQRNITSLYKSYMVLAEDLQHDHHSFLRKLKEAGVSEELLNKLDYFDAEKYTYIRKKVLDIGNEANRDLDKYFQVLDITLDESFLERNNLDIKDLLKHTKNTSVEYNKESKKYRVKGKLL